MQEAINDERGRRGLTHITFNEKLSLVTKIRNHDDELRMKETPSLHSLLDHVGYKRNFVYASYQTGARLAKDLVENMMKSCGGRPWFLHKKVKDFGCHMLVPGLGLLRTRKWCVVVASPVLN